MKKLPKPIPSSAPRQLSMGFNSVRLRVMEPDERASALSLLASVLMEAAGDAAGESSDDQC